MSMKTYNEWAESHPTVSKWINRIGESTKDRYLPIFYRYIQWLRENGGEFKEETPEELVEYQSTCPRKDEFKQLDTLQEWLTGLKYRVGTKKLMYSAVRSFFLHNRASLPEDGGFKLRSEIPPVEGILDVEDFKKIILSCNTTYQVVFLIMFQGGMGPAEFEFFNLNGWEEIKDKLSSNEPIKISFSGRKHGGSYRSQPFYTFIGRDAKDALLKYLREERGSIGKGEAILLSERGAPINRKTLLKYFTRHAILAGVITPITPACPECRGTTRKKWGRINGKNAIHYICNECDERLTGSDLRLKEFREMSKGIRYGVNPHELRDVFRTEWGTSPAKEVVAEFCMGHEVDPLKYNKFHRNVEYVMGEYRKAEDYFNIMSQNPRVVSKYDVTELKRRVNGLEEENKLLREQNGVKAFERDEIKKENIELRERFDSLKNRLDVLEEAERERRSFLGLDKPTTPEIRSAEEALKQAYEKLKEEAKRHPERYPWSKAAKSQS